MVIACDSDNIAWAQKWLEFFKSEFCRLKDELRNMVRPITS